MSAKVSESTSKLLGVYWAVFCSVLSMALLVMGHVDIMMKVIQLGVFVSVGLIVPKTAAETFVKIYGAKQ